MKQADLLTAMFRQIGSTKTGGKSALNGGLLSKDGKEKAEHFREQMRQVSKDAPVVPRIDKNSAHIGTAAAPHFEVAAVLAELTGEVRSKPTAEEKPKDDDDKSKSAGDGKQTVSGHDWHDPNAALSAVMSKFDQPQQNSGRDGKPASQSHTTQPDIKIDNVPIDQDKLAQGPDIDVPATKRVTVSVEAADTKAVSTAKPVVREQETHFEPVQQVTTLQKIVDRMANDLPAIAAPDGAQTAEAPLHEAAKLAESRPVRMMTLELDPPNLGSVTIKMRLAGDSVEVRLTADRLETTHLLRQERGALTDAMQSAGYSFDIAAIDHTRSPDANNNSQPQSQPHQQQASSDQRGSMSSSNGSQPDSGASGRSSGEGQSGARQNRQDHDQTQTSSEREQDQGGRRIRSSTVYL